MTVHWIDVRDDAAGWLLFRYDPHRRLIEIKQRGRKVLVDLTQFSQDEPRPLDKTPEA